MSRRAAVMLFVATFTAAGASGCHRTVIIDKRSDGGASDVGAKRADAGVTSKSADDDCSRSVTLTGTVLWTATSKPPTSAQVRAYTMGVPLGDVVETDAKGRFELTIDEARLPANRTVDLRVSAEWDYGEWVDDRQSVTLDDCEQDVVIHVE